MGVRINDPAPRDLNAILDVGDVRIVFVDYSGTLEDREVETCRRVVDV